MELISKDMIYLVLHFVVIALLLRSVFFLFRARKKMRIGDFLILVIPLIAGIFFLIDQSDDTNMLAKRFPWMIFFLIGAANAFYMLSKSAKENAFSIHNLLIEQYSSFNKKTLDKISNRISKVCDITWDELSQFEINKPYIIDKKTAICRYANPFKLTHMFMGYLKKDGEFSIQTHSDCEEFIAIHKGKVLELYSNKIYEQGDTLKIKVGQPHGFKGLVDYTEIRGYLTKVK